MSSQSARVTCALSNVSMLASRQGGVVMTAPAAMTKYYWVDHGDHASNAAISMTVRHTVETVEPGATAVCVVQGLCKDNKGPGQQCLLMSSFCCDAGVACGVIVENKKPRSPSWPDA